MIAFISGHLQRIYHMDISKVVQNPRGMGFSDSSRHFLYNTFHRGYVFMVDTTAGALHLAVPS